jgi:hypothetical protein
MLLKNILTFIFWHCFHHKTRGSSTGVEHLSSHPKVEGR